MDKHDKAKMIESIEANIYHLLGKLKVDLHNEHLKNTPIRVARAYVKEIFRGYFDDEPKLTMFKVDQSRDQMVTIAGIQFYSTCAHHMLPFQGKAYIGYIPDEQMLGVSKFARIVDWFARRLTVQEILTTDIANYIVEKLDPLGVGVQLRASHACMVCRGVMQSDSEMITTALRRYFMTRPHVKNEWIQCIR
ncbi:GTP cyclohydrolase I [Candidatus Pacearchaeota archaeon]|nr:GTP cyclohydrolase I [Candidatus Pacearchaeota archaeon]